MSKQSTIYNEYGLNYVVGRVYNLLGKETPWLPQQVYSRIGGNYG
ncbi:hypothetical protein [Sphingobacterium pedocola]|nr:hypothetical protein [Sphingobacterium pedocola]